MILKQSRVLKEVASTGGLSCLINPITQASIPCNQENRNILQKLVGPRAIESEGDTEFSLLQEEMFERGFLVPSHIKDEVDFWNKREPLIVNQMSFFQVPKKKPSLVNSKWAIMGAPYDAAAAKAGCRYGPELIRERSYSWCFRSKGQSSQLQSLASRKPLNLAKLLSDVGDLKVNSYDAPIAASQKLSQAIELLPKGVRPICIGGDHSLSYGALMGIGKQYKDGEGLLFVQLDQHMDLQNWGSFRDDGMPKLDELRHSNFLSHALEKMPKLKVHQIGLRSYQSINSDISENFSSYCDEKIDYQMDDLSALTLWPLQMNENVPKSKDVYLSIDVDVLSSVFVSQTGYPSAMGLSLENYFRYIDLLTKQNKIVGLDVMEFGQSQWPNEHRLAADIIVASILRIVEGSES